MLPIVCIVAFLAYLYAIFYANGDYLLGAEGSFYLDYILLAKNFGYFWYNAAVGYIATSYNFLFHLILVQWLFGSERLINFITIASLYVLPFIAVYLLCLELKINAWLALLFSVFYLVNPFTVYFLYSINQWNMIASYIFPAFFLIILKFYRRPIFLFTVFGLHSAFFTFGNANPPTMALYQVAMVISVLVISTYINKRFDLKDVIFHYLLVLASFVLFNFWWLIDWLVVFSQASSSLSTVYSLGWLKNAGWQRPVLWRSFTLHGLLPFPRNQVMNYLDVYFGNNLGEILSLIPVALVSLSLLKKQLVTISMAILGVSLVSAGFLAKGTNPPLGNLYELAIVYIPIFKIFKTAPEKWGVLFVFLLTLYLIFIVRDLSSSIFRKIVLLCLAGYTIFSAVPFLTGNFLPDYTYDGWLFVTKHFPYKKEYLDLREKLNNDPLQYRVFSLPGHLNYQIALDIGNGKYYGGPDPVLTNTNKPYIAPYNNLFAPEFMFLFRNISNPDLAKILGLYNVKKIVINKDMFPWFGYAEKESIEDMEKIFDRQFVSVKDSAIDFYDIGNAFIPRLYLAKQIVNTDLPTTDLPKVVSTVKQWDRPAISFSSSLDHGVISKDAPDLIFQRVNPTKYKLSLKKIKGSFLLVFSENFHPSWKLYPAKPGSLPVNETDLVGDFYNGEIKQLADRQAFFDNNPGETWSTRPIANDRHYQVNGYANAWLVKPEDINGAEEAELILEYFPQRYFYPGVAVSLITVVISLVLVIKNLVRPLVLRKIVR